VAACNNCPCGWFASRKRKCQCNSTKLIAYWNRLSGPILDRIDMHLNIPESAHDPADMLLQLHETQLESQTARLRQQVAKGRTFGRARNKALGLEFNHQLRAKHIVTASGLDRSAFTGLVRQVSAQDVSQRSLLRTLRVARTLADIDESPVIDKLHLLEAWRWQAEEAAKERGEHAFRMQ